MNWANNNISYLYSNSLSNIINAHQNMEYFIYIMQKSAKFWILIKFRRRMEDMEDDN